MERRVHLRPCRSSATLGSDLEEGENEDVNHERLDEREAENHRHEELVARAGVARDALERSSRGATLSHRAAERREAKADEGRRECKTRAAGLLGGAILREGRGADEKGGDECKETKGELLHGESLLAPSPGPSALGPGEKKRGG